MKNSFRNLLLAVAICAATAASAIAGSINVIVSDSGGKAAFKGATDTKGTFATPKLQKGNYTVQFNSKDPSLKGNSYAVVISAGKKKVAADSVAGDKFAAGGVAMKIDVGDGLNITGQVSAPVKTMVDKNGKKMVWIPKRVGSNIPAHWAPEDSAEAKEAKAAGSLSIQNVRNMQDQNSNIPQSGVSTVGTHP
jgi:hypothetical protein